MQYVQVDLFDAASECLMRTCQRCGVPKPPDDFSVRSDSPTGKRRKQCKACVVDIARQWRRRNPEKYQAQLARDAQRKQQPERRAQKNAREKVLGKARRAARSPKGRTFSTVCTRCGETFEYVHRARKRTVCDLCRKHDSAWTAFRLTGEQAEELRARGRCDICGGTRPGGRFNNWHIDHDHATGVVRGVLCAACNTAIGLLGESPERIIAAAEYVAAHQARPALARQTLGLTQGSVAS